MTRGDINNDGSVDIVDLNALHQAVQNDESPDNGDLNNDGAVNIVDVNALQQHVVEGEPLPEIETESQSETKSDYSADTPLVIDGSDLGTRINRTELFLLNDATKEQIEHAERLLRDDHGGSLPDWYSRPGSDSDSSTDSDDSRSDASESTSQTESDTEVPEQLPDPSGSSTEDASTDDDTTDDTSTSEESDSGLPVDPKTAIAAGIGLLALLGGS